MKVTEFRVGNLLELPNKQTVQISINSLKEIESGIHPYQKISLTEEWLLKFGFEHMQYSDMLGKSHNGYRFGDFRIIKGGSWTYNNVLLGLIPDLKYVHQLQNLYFALTNTELEIK